MAERNAPLRVQSEGRGMKRALSRGADRNKQQRPSAGGGTRFGEEQGKEWHVEITGTNSRYPGSPSNQD